MIPITTASKPVKYTGINSTKEVKELYSEKKKKILMKEAKEYTNKWKSLSCL